MSLCFSHMDLVQVRQIIITYIYCIIHHPLPSNKDMYSQTTSMTTIQGERNILLPVTIMFWWVQYNLVNLVDYYAQLPITFSVVIFESIWLSPIVEKEHFPSPWYLTLEMYIFSSLSLLGVSGLNSLLLHSVTIDGFTSILQIATKSSLLTSFHQNVMKVSFT